MTEERNDRELIERTVTDLQNSDAAFGELAIAPLTSGAVEIFIKEPIDRGGSVAHFTVLLPLESMPCWSALSSAP